ncbi:MAG: tRNA adenosine(34) deaminase TadA [Candidatus Cloacimonetes bacterium]|nr:tRNA adenosine(34) deaminase TadA [Candidatus Cloacimonadota bacterium]
MIEHEIFMRMAIREARKAESRQEVPVGAVVVHRGHVIGRGHNGVEHLQDPTAHAEILAIGAAANALGSWRLEDCVLYATLEPCAMCAGALVLARVPLLVYGAPDPKAGGCGSVNDIIADTRLNHQVSCLPGVLEGECAELLRSFFRDLRARARESRELPGDPAGGASARDDHRN